MNTPQEPDTSQRPASESPGSPRPRRRRRRKAQGKSGGTPSPKGGKLDIRAATNQQMAAALGLSYSSLVRFRQRGLPMPAVGEDLRGWAARVGPWIVATRRRPGPKPQVPAPGDDAGGGGGTLNYWTVKWRQARAQRELLELDRARGNVHDLATCERAAVRRLQDVLAALRQVGDRCARLLGHVAPADLVKDTIEAEIRAALEQLRRDAAAAAEPDDDDAQDATPAPAVAQ